MAVCGVAGLWPPYLGVAYCRICATSLFVAAVLGLSPFEVMVVALLTMPGAFLLAQGRLGALLVPLALGGPPALLSACVGAVGSRWRNSVVVAAFALWFLWPLLGWVAATPILWPWTISPLLWGEAVVWGVFWPALAGAAFFAVGIALRRRV